MKVTKTVAVIALLLYVGLWVLAANGATILIEPLAIPLILAILVAVLVWFQRFMGFRPRSPKFQEPKDPKDTE
jgi:fatty acid desaturase